MTRIILFCLLAGAALTAAARATAAPCSARDLSFDQKAAGWAHQALSKVKRDTVYTLVPEDGRSVLRAEADRSASMYSAHFRQPAGVPASLSWRWKTDALVPGADNRDKTLEDAPLRVIVEFDGDISTLPEAEQKNLKRAKMIARRDVPFSTLMYIWSDHVPVETVIPSAHTSQVQMLVVASGTGGLGAWQSVRRDLAADYRRAYNAAPGPVLGVAVMTDTDNTGAKAIGYYADIRLACPGR